MFARLWWKDTRQFWPIWAVLVLTAGGIQWLVLKYPELETDKGVLLYFAVGWAAVYAIAVGSAAFAGEREMGTMALLDALPVSRRLLWGGKTSFAVASTFGLALVLLTMAALGTTRDWQFRHDLGQSWYALGCAIILLEALGWGLFWSARLNNPLSAAVMSVICTIFATYFVMAVIERFLVHFTSYDPFGIEGFISTIPIRLGIIALTLAASARLMIRGPRRFADYSPARRVRTRLRFRSPLVVEGPARPARPPRLRKPVWPEVRVLLWQTLREGFSTWWVLLGIGVGASVLFTILENGANPGFILLLNLLVGLVAGVHVFNVENRALTQRFLANHGARPGLVWLVKVGVWTFGVGAIWFWVVPLLAFARTPVYMQERWEPLAVLFALTIGAFPAGLLCGMVVRRGITAVVVALLVLALLCLPVGILLAMQMIPLTGVLVMPLGLVLITWIWRRDWMFERPAPGRYVRLGLLLAGLILVVSTGYVGYRLYSVRQIDPLPAPAGWYDVVPEAENAAPLYEEALRIVSPNEEFKHIPREGEVALFNRLAKAHKDAHGAELDVIRRASTLPHYQPVRPDRLTLFTPMPPFPPAHFDAGFVERVARDHLAHGDLDAAWDDLMVLFRMSRQVAQSPRLDQRVRALYIEKPALELAMKWSCAKVQTAERVRAALKAYRALPPMPPVSEAVKAEARVIEQTLALPREDLINGLFTNGSDAARAHTRPLGIEMMTMPWEIVRTRNVLRLIMADALDQASQEPWQRDYIEQRTGRIMKGGVRGTPTPRPYGVPPGTIVGYAPRGSNPDLLASTLRQPELTQARDTTPLVQHLEPAIASILDQDALHEVNRRAMEIYLALRIHQIEHKGQLPHDLVTFESPDLPTLPLDPFYPGTFGYVQPGGPLPPSALNGMMAAMMGSYSGSPAKPPEWVLYSVGPDRVDNHAMVRSQWLGPGDIVFDLPPEGPAAPDVKLPEDPFEEP